MWKKATLARILKVFRVKYLIWVRKVKGREFQKGLKFRGVEFRINKWIWINIWIGFINKFKIKILPSISTSHTVTQAGYTEYVA